MRWLSLSLLLSTSAYAAPIELVHQGRLLDTEGSPLNGSLSIVVTLYNDPIGSEEANQLFQETFSTTTLLDGYYTLRLGTDTPNRLQSEVFAATDVYLELSVEGEADPERTLLHHVPLAAYAQTSGGVTLDSSGLLATPCSPLGALVFDTSLDFLKVCSSQGWSGASGPVPIITSGAGRAYADGTHAITCDGYLNPDLGYAYAGQTGDSTYTIDPDGPGTGVSPFDVECDMTGGGWTVLNHNFVGGTIPNKSVEAPSELYQTLTYPQSNTQIQALMAIVTQTSQSFHKNCRDSLINEDYGSSYTRFELPNGTFVNSTQALWGGGSKRDCDFNDAVNRVSSITFVDTPNIPIMAIWGGDSGSALEVSTFQIGAFRAR